MIRATGVTQTEKSDLHIYQFFIFM